MIASIFASVLMMTTAQSAEDFEAACKDYQAEYGGESDCSCLAEKAAADEDLLNDLLQITEPADIANASEAAIAAIQDCTDSE